MRADRATPYAMPPWQLTRPTRRELRPFPLGRGIRNPVRGGRPGHRALQLTPLRNSASTSARRYRGLPASLRTSGSRPRRAQVATAAEVTPNKDATCLRVIRSSPMRLPALAAAGPGQRAWPGRSPAGRVAAPSRSSDFPRSRNELIRGSAGYPARLLPGTAPGKIPNCPAPVARKMLLQIAARNIGQLTDVELSLHPQTT